MYLVLAFCAHIGFWLSSSLFSLLTAISGRMLLALSQFSIHIPSEEKLKTPALLLSIPTASLYRGLAEVFCFPLFSSAKGSLPFLLP